MPEHVVLGRVEGVPEVPDVARQPAYDEHDDERQHQTSHLFTGLHLQQHVRPAAIRDFKLPPRTVLPLSEHNGHDTPYQR